MTPVLREKGCPEYVGILRGSERKGAAENRPKRQYSKITVGCQVVGRRRIATDALPVPEG